MANVVKKHSISSELAQKMVDEAVAIANAVWTYEAPHEAVSVIKDHLAFYPDRVEAIEEGPGA